MKNKIITAYIILLSFATIFSLYIPKNEVTAKEEIVIPNEAIRLRILANSDAEADQALKRKVRDAVNAEITKWVQDLTSLEEARTVIQSHLPEIQQIAEQVVESENATQTVTAQFDKVEFPTKLYGQFLYPAGEYEAILITLGEGEGANWWCVLFPPLCFLDISNGVAVSDGFDEKKPKNEKPASKKVKQAAEESKNAPSAPEATSTPVEQPNDEEVNIETASSGQTQKVAQALTATPAKVEMTKAEVAQAEKSEAVKSAQLEAEKQASPAVTAGEKADKTEQKAPVYTEEDEQEVEVKFFIKELWTKLF
ncbi:stage II sporulation protein R [Neobacillus sp. LXY-4]|uniref:stage II sporulation protein R n=1 Tax=Neobacillus sp. LXY-4 TaxID=3379826 RepID=UPI003EE174F8